MATSLVLTEHDFAGLAARLNSPRASAREAAQQELEALPARELMRLLDCIEARRRHTSEWTVIFAIASMFAPLLFGVVFSGSHSHDSEWVEWLLLILAFTAPFLTLMVDQKRRERLFQRTPHARQAVLRQIAAYTRADMTAQALLWLHYSKLDATPMRPYTNDTLGCIKVYFARYLAQAPQTQKEELVANHELTLLTLLSKGELNVSLALELLELLSERGQHLHPVSVRRLAAMRVDTRETAEVRNAAERCLKRMTEREEQRRQREAEREAEKARSAYLLRAATNPVPAPDVLLRPVDNTPPEAAPEQLLRAVKG